MNGAVTLTRRQSQVDHFVGRKLQVEAGRDECTVDAAVVGSESGHCHHLFVQVEGVLGVGTWCGLLLVPRQIVVVQRKACREVVLLGEVGLEHQLGVGVLLVDVVVFLAVLRIQLMQRGITHDGDVRAVLGVDDEGVLHVGLVAVGLHVDDVRVMHVRRRVVVLSAIALFAEHAEPAVEDVAGSPVLPAVLQVELLYHGFVQESVVVFIMVSPVVLVVSQQLRTGLVVYVDIAVGISLQAAVGIAVEVDGNALLVFWFQVVHVDLSRYRLIAVANRRCPLRHLDALHPRAGNVA